MRSALVRAALALSVLLVAVTPASAQMFGALGKPLPSGELPNGTLSVRVIQGDASQPAIGVDVTVTVAGSGRAARTDSEGRALFPGIPAGATVQASVRGPDGEIKSDQFPFPDKGGVRVLLTTKPLTADPGGAGPGGGMPGMGGGMPEPRQMSGQPRPEPKDPGGMITVRVTHNDFQGAAPVHQLVYLVAYGADGTIKATTQNTDAAGRAEWKGLDVSGATSYFALTTLPRGNGTVDRLISSPMVPDGQAGIRLILSGAKQGSTEPPIDDVDNFAEQSKLPPGRINVQLDWVPNASAKVALVDALTGETVATAAPRNPSPVAGSLTAAVSGVTEDGVLAAGNLILAVTRQTARGATPVAEGTVAFRPVGGAVIVELPVANGQVAAEKLPVGVPLEAVIAVGEERVTTAPFTLPASGGGARATLGVDWKARGALEARFDGAAADRTFYVDVAMNGERYRSFPFQTVADRGVSVAVAVVPRVLFKFSLSSAVEDAYYAVQGRWEVQNWAWAPYRDGPDGILVPLPEGFSGPVIFDVKDQVATEPKGFRILRPLPPGGLRFHGGFSLKIKDGGIRWDMELPRGVFDSGIQIRMTEGMKVDVPSGEDGRVMRDDDGTPYYVIPNISIRPGQRMVMSINNLPSEPMWKVWVPRLVGILGLLVVGIGLFAAFSVRRPALATAAVDTTKVSRARIDALYDELVALDRGGKGEASPRRAEILAELERLLAARAAGPKA
jgi:hypothetical protein